MKSGVTTSEFWLTLANGIMSSALLYTGHISAEMWLGLNGGLAAWYNGNRTVLKIKNGGKKK